MNDTRQQQPSPMKPDQEPEKGKPGRPRGTGKHAGMVHTQAAQIIAKFGGEAALAAALGINRATPYRWQYARPYGTGGVIPVAMVEAIQRAARREGIILLPEDWNPGRAALSTPTPQLEAQ